MFELTDNKDRFYGIYETEEKAYEAIKSYLTKIGFKTYYYRQSFLEDGVTWVDYGSHTHFFYIKRVMHG